ncbi:MAG: hypothetical protein HFH63_12675 [Lachnospiraceae bacterium]|nr:hypothetical protein [Lachnospiraceae bacterium]
MNELSISQKYSQDKYNLLGNTDVIASIPDIKSPVIQTVRLNPDPKKGEVYIQQHANSNNPNLYAITKNGLKKLADGAGIKMLSSEHVIPATCQKCVAVNQHSGKVVQCGNCNNKDVAYRVTISVPQLTGEVLTVEDTHEIIVENVTPSMTGKQKAEFMKHLPQICEAKALNGAIRTALHIKGTYTLEELQKPFVVAYLVPNLNHQDVKRAAIENMFQSSANLFGNTPSVQQIESRVPESSAIAIEAADGENYDAYIDGTYKEDIPDNKTEADNNVIQQDYYCDKCGEPVTKKVWNYSVDKFERPLCYKCQKLVRDEQGGAGR